MARAKKKHNKANKGSSFERDVCRRLTHWWTSDPAADVLYWRTSQSGGRATTRKKAGKVTNRAHHGDIYALGEVGAELTKLIAWELKNGYKRASLHDVLARRDISAQQTYEEWIKQASTAAQLGGAAYWAIVHRKGFSEDILTIPYDLWKALDCSTTTIRPPVFDMTIMLEEHGIRIVSMRFEEFLKGVSPVEIRRLFRNGQSRRPG